VVVDFDVSALQCNGKEARLSWLEWFAAFAGVLGAMFSISFGNICHSFM
jgi:hypothetical protein